MKKSFKIFFFYFSIDPSSGAGANTLSQDQHYKENIYPKEQSYSVPKDKDEVWIQRSGYKEPLKSVQQHQQHLSYQQHYSSHLQQHPQQGLIKTEPGYQDPYHPGKLFDHYSILIISYLKCKKRYIMAANLFEGYLMNK